MAADMKLALILEARTDRARAELGATRTALEALGVSASKAGTAATGTTSALQRLIELNTGVTSATGMTAAQTLEYGRALDQVRARFNPLFAESQRYTDELRDIARAEEIGAISALEAAAARDRAAAAMAPMAAGMRGLGAGAGAAQANMANLGFQMNDIIMMATMGQAPLAIMMQQGMQVTQVFGQMRAQGQALGPALTGMLRGLLNPMTLVTMAVIGAGAALVQWGMDALGAGEKAKTFEERLADLTGILNRMDGYDFSDMFAGMEVQAEAIRGKFAETLRLIERAQGVGLQQALSEAVAGVGLQEALIRHRYDSDIAGRLGMDEPQFSALGFQDYGQAIAAAEVLHGITGETRQEVAASFEAAVQWLRSCGLLTAELEAQLAVMAEGLGIQRLVRQEAEAQAEAVRTAHAHTDALREAVEADARARARAAEAALEAARADRDRAGTMLEGLGREAALREAISRYGADSAEVARLRVAQEREVQQRLVESLNVSGEMKAELMAAWDAARGLAATAIAGPIGAGANEAARLATNLEAAMGAVQALQSANLSAVVQNAGVRAEVAALDAGQSAADAAIARSLAETRTRLAPALGGPDMGARLAATQELAEAERLAREGAELNTRRAALLEALNRSGTGAGTGAGSGGAAAQADEAARLIDSLTGELAVLRELDPVQRELLRHREALAAATPEQAAAVEELVAQTIAERSAMEDLQEQMRATRALGADLVRTLVDGFREGASAGEILGSMLERIADRLIDLGANGLTDWLFGTGRPGGGPGVLGGLLSGGFGGGFGGGGGLKVGLNALGNVYDRPLMFAARGGLGLMAEAGPEAIMPLTHAYGGGVGARIGGTETALPLARLASGKLGVDLGAAASPFAMGGTFGDIASAAAPASWRQALSGSGPAASGPDRSEATLRLILPPGWQAEIEGRMQAVALEVAGTTVDRALRTWDRGFNSRVHRAVADRRAR